MDYLCRIRQSNLSLFVYVSFFLYSFIWVCSPQEPDFFLMVSFNYHLGKVSVEDCIYQVGLCTYLEETVTIMVTDMIRPAYCGWYVPWLCFTCALFCHSVEITFFAKTHMTDCLLFLPLLMLLCTIMRLHMCVEHVIPRSIRILNCLSQDIIET